MTVRIGYLVIDAVDPSTVARFWCGLLGLETDSLVGDGQFTVLTSAGGSLPLVIQRVPEAKTGKNRLHLDLVVQDLDGGTALVESLGGRWVDPGTTHDLDGFLWRVMSDPEGNEFDLQVDPSL